MDPEEKKATHPEHVEYSLIFPSLYDSSGLSMGSTKQNKILRISNLKGDKRVQILDLVRALVRR